MLPDEDGGSSSDDSNVPVAPPEAPQPGELPTSHLTQTASRASEVNLPAEPSLTHVVNLPVAPSWEPRLHEPREDRDLPVPAHPADPRLLPDSPAEHLPVATGNAGIPLTPAHMQTGQPDHAGLAQATRSSSSGGTLRLGYAPVYVPEYDPWHEDGYMSPREMGVTDSPPPPEPQERQGLQQTVSEWSQLAREYAQEGPGGVPQPETDQHHAALPSTVPHANAGVTSALPDAPAADPTLSSATTRRCEVAAELADEAHSTAVPAQPVHQPVNEDAEGEQPTTVQSCEAVTENTASDATCVEELEEDEDALSDSDDEDSDDEEEDEDDTDTMTATTPSRATSSTARPAEQGATPSKPKRRAGQGSQRFRNKDQKNDIKALWYAKDWGDKPDWLSWRRALQWIRRGEQPPERKPGPRPDDFKSMLNAHLMYTRGGDGRVIPTSQPVQLPQQPRPQQQTQPSPQAPQHPHDEDNHGRQTASLKADTAAPAARRDLSRTTTRPTTDSAGEASTANSHRPATTPTVPLQASTESSNSLTKQQTAAAADHKQRLATNPYLHGRSDSHLSDPDRDQHHRAETSSEAAKDGRPQPSTTPGTGSQPQPKQPPRRQPPTPPLPRRPDHQVQFRLPPDHRDQPPRPQRMRPNTSHASQRQPQPPVTEGDPLFTQPPHSRTDQQPSSTAGSSTDPPRPDATATATNSQPPGIADLHRAATAAAMQGRAPSWRITARHQRGDSLQSTHRVGANSQDLSWLPGASPTTLPPPFPLQARTILSLRGAANGAWRGNVWIPLPDQTVSHPVRHEHEPTLVAYNTLGSYVSSDPVMPPGTQFTIWPYGEIIGVTKIGDGFARTPRFWLFQVDFAPKPEEGNNPLQISSGESFWLEWRGEDRSWRRHPRFTDDVTRFGGPAVFSPAVPPRPPTPPERRHPTGRHPSRTRAHQQHHTGTPTQQSQPSGAANNTHHPRHTQQTPATAQRAILDPAALQGAAFATLHAAQQQGRGMGPQQQPRSVTQPVSQQQAPPRRLPTTTPNRSQAVPKPRPPQPPDSGSESETSWRSEDPPGPDAAPLLQVQLRNHSHHNHHNHPEHERHGHASAPPQPRPYNSPPPPTQLPLWSRGLAPAMTLLTTSAPRRPEGKLINTFHYPAPVSRQPVPHPPQPRLDKPHATPTKP